MDQFLSDFIDQFAQEFDDGLVVSKETIELSTPFRDTVTWDSIAVLYIVAMMEDIYGVKITGKQLAEELVTFGDLVQLIQSR